MIPIEAGVRMVQPDIVKMGDFTGMWRCAAVAEAHGVELVPHHTQPTIGHTANLHLVASLLHMTKPCEWKTRRHASTRCSKIPPNQPPVSCDADYCRSGLS